MDNLITITDEYNQETTIQRDTNGKATSITASHGQQTDLRVDANDDLLEAVYEDSSSYSFEYKNHLMTKEIDQNGNESFHIFDKSGKIIQVIDTEQNSWLFGKTDEIGNNLITIQKPEDSISYRKYQLSNNMLQTDKILPNGDTISTVKAINYCTVLRSNNY